MIKLKDILPGDIIVSRKGTRGVVCELHEIPKDFVEIRNSHLQGGSSIWAFWNDRKYPQHCGLNYISEHRCLPWRKSSVYDPEQQPWEEGDI